MEYNCKKSDNEVRGIDRRMKKKEFCNIVLNDAQDVIFRDEFKPILDLIPSNSKVLDLGCGDGSLGYKLITMKSCEVSGVDLSEEVVKKAKEKGIVASVGDLEEGLEFPDETFDYVVICDVLEHVIEPLCLLKEALRVSKRYVIVAFPNFGYFVCRLQALTGVFPKAIHFGMKWYNSTHITLFSLKDFLNALKELNFNVKVSRSGHIASKRIPRFLIRISPTLFACVCVLELEKGEGWNYKNVREYYDV